MEQMQQKDVGALDLQAVSQKDVEQACFHTLGLISRNCEYLEQHLAHQRRGWIVPSTRF